MAEENAKGLNLPLLLGIIILVIIMAAGTSFLMVYLFSNSKANANGAGGEVKKVEKAEKPGPTFALDEFIVNLVGNQHYLRLNMVMEMNNDKAVEEITERTAQVRDAINQILRSQKVEDVQDPTLKNLKAQILTRVNQLMAKGRVRDVWFTVFQIQ